jgi:hypothetical protein
MSDTQIPAGWYPDPAGDTTKVRYWNGFAWSEQLQDAASISASTPAVPLPQASPLEPPPPSSATFPATPYAPPQTTHYYQQAPTYDATQKDTSGKATASLVCGIVGIFGAALLALAGYILGIIAIVFGVSGRKSNKKSMATAGIVLGIIALIVALINSILGVINAMAVYF